MIVNNCFNCYCILQESDAEGLRARIRKLQAELSDAEENMATLNATITKMRSSARKPPSKVIHHHQIYNW